MGPQSGSLSFSADLYRPVVRPEARAPPQEVLETSPRVPTSAIGEDEAQHWHAGVNDDDDLETIEKKAKSTLYSLDGEELIASMDGAPDVLRRSQEE